MPYAPGVTDISGQLIAQGIGQAAQAYAQKVGSISNAVTGFMQTYQQNQLMTNQAMGKFQGALRSDPALQKYIQDAASDDPNAPKLSPELQKAIDNAKAGKVDVYDAAVLGNFVDTWGSNRNQIAQREHILLQNKLLGQQIAQGDVNMQAYQDALLRQRQRIAGVAAPMGQPMAADAPQTPAGIPAQAIQAVQAAQAANAPAAVRPPEGLDQFVDGGLRSRTGWNPSAAWSPNNPVGVIDEQRLRDEMIIGSRGGRSVSEKDIAAELDRRTKIQKDALQAAEIQLSNPIPNPRDQGRTLIVLDKQTGRVVSSMPNPQHPEVAGQTALATDQAKRDSEFIDQVRQKGATAEDERFVNAEIRKMLSSGVNTGPIEGFKTELKKLAVNAGLGSEKEIEEANSYEKLDSLMMRQQLEIAQTATRGNLNTFEQQLVQRAVAGARNKLPGANAYLNDVVDAYKAKMADRARFENQLPDDLSTTQRARAVRDWELRKENSINNYFEQLQPKVQRVRLTGNQLGAQVLEPAGTSSVAPVAPSRAANTLPPGWSIKP